MKLWNLQRIEAFGKNYIKWSHPPQNIQLHVLSHMCVLENDVNVDKALKTHRLVGDDEDS